jgi:hypothetical protein
MKSLNELTTELKDELAYYMTSQTATTKESYHRCKNLKMSMRPDLDASPHVIISMMMSEAVFSLADFEKLKGGLGPEEKFVLRWFGRPGVRESLNANWTLLAGGRQLK